MRRGLDDCSRAIFRLFPSQERYSSFAYGSAFVIHDPRYAITAAHVVADYSNDVEWLLLAEHWRTSGRVLAIDVNNDVAVLRLSDPATISLDAANHSSAVPDALAAWDWPDASNLTERAFRPAAFAQLRLPSLASDTLTRISFVGHVRKGMSGGPLVAFDDGSVQGVVVNARTPPLMNMRLLSLGGRTYEAIGTAPLRARRCSSKDCEHNSRSDSGRHADRAGLEASARCRITIAAIDKGER